MLIKSVRGFTPKYGDDCFIAENATLIGDVIMGNPMFRLVSGRGKRGCQFHSRGRSS